MNVRPIGINRKRLSWLLKQPIDVKAEMLSHHLEISRMLINDILEDEVEQLSGPRYSHVKPHNGQYSRWGHNPGSVRVGAEKVRVDVPRVYDNEEKCHKPLESYQQLRQPNRDDADILKAILLGLSTQDYREVIQQLLDSFGLSRSSVSKSFIEESSEKLKIFENRDLSSNDFIALFIDGKSVAKDQIVIVLGITTSGEKIPLGFIQTHTENSESISQLLSNLVERGFNYKQGILCVIDGSKGIDKAVKQVFGDYCLVQRCQWHKRENVVSYLNEHDQNTYRRKLNKAYQADTYKEAKQQLLMIKDELEIKNLSSAKSLQEGFEETLTLHRLGLMELFGRSFATTNCIENLNSQLEKYIRKVKIWKNSKQRYRWIASAMLEIEQKMKKVNQYKKLYIMQKNIQDEITLTINKKRKAA